MGKQGEIVQNIKANLRNNRNPNCQRGYLVGCRGDQGPLATMAAGPEEKLTSNDLLLLLLDSLVKSTVKTT